MSDQPPITAGVEACYRHPNVQTGVHCTRCGKPICPECMVEAPVGFQCPDCVAEARKAFKQSGAGPQTLRSQAGTPVTFGLLAALGIMFVVQIATGGNVMQATANIINLGAEVPLLVAAGEYWRLASAIFLHAGILHLAMNGYGLYLFGSFVERSFGKGHLIAMFFVTGLVASATSYALAPESGWATPSLGASGAVFGLFGVFAAYFFRRRNTRYGRAMFQQAMFWLMFNVILGFSIPNIDWKAHLGGVVAGFIGGYFLELETETSRRKSVQVLVYVGLIALALALVAYKTVAIREVVPADQLAQVVEMFKAL